jgi:hypothetical protein
MCARQNSMRPVYRSPRLHQHRSAVLFVRSSLRDESADGGKRGVDDVLPRGCFREEEGLRTAGYSLYLPVILRKSQMIGE